jgi:hypothetical protein
MPVKAADAVLTSAPVKMKKEAIRINGAIAGRLKFVAKKPERTKERMESDKPRTISKSKPETKTLLILATLFSLLYWAEYFIMAVLIPQSRNVEIRFGAVRAIAYKP